MPGTCQAWSATGRTPDARSVVNFSSSVTGISSRVTISRLRVAAHLVAPAFPDGGILRFGDRLQPVPLCRSCALNQICLCSTPKRPGPFLALGFQQFAEIVNEPGSLSGLVGQMTVRGRLDRVDGSTSHPMQHPGALRDRIHFLSYEPKTDLHLRHKKLSAPKRGSLGPSLGSESYLSRRA